MVTDTTFEVKFDFWTQGVRLSFEKDRFRLYRAIDPNFVTYYLSMYTGNGIETGDQFEIYVNVPQGILIRAGVQTISLTVEYDTPFMNSVSVGYWQPATHSSTYFGDGYINIWQQGDNFASGYLIGGEPTFSVSFKAKRPETTGVRITNLCITSDTTTYCLPEQYLLVTVTAYIPRQYGFQFPSSQFTLFSLPATFANMERQNLFPFLNFVWRWDRASQQYIFVLPSDTLEVGEGYWGYSHNGGQSTLPEGPENNRVFGTQLKRGWNLIGAGPKTGFIFNEQFLPAGVFAAYGWDSFTASYYNAWNQFMFPTSANWVACNYSATLYYESGVPRPPLGKASTVDFVAEFGDGPPPPPTLSTTDVSDQSPALLPTEFALKQNYPNPFNPSTTIKYALPEPSRVSIKIYDTLGRDVATLIEGAMTAGNHEVVWNGRAADGEQVASGIYFVKMHAGTFSQTRRMLMMK